MRGAWMLLAVLTPQIAAPAVRAQTVVPQDARLQALQDAAEKLQNDNLNLSSRRAEVRDAWVRLRDAAGAVMVRPGVQHPLYGLALIKIASQDIELGNSAGGIEGARAGIAALGPNRAAYMSTYAEGVSLLALLLSQSGQAKLAAEQMREGLAVFTPWYDALPAAARTREIATSKSNLEFALSQTLSRLGDTVGAVEQQRMSMETRRTALGPNDSDTIGSYYGYANVLLRADRFVEAEQYARLAVDAAVAHLPTEHTSYARAYEMLGIVLSQTGRRQEGVDYLTRALEIKRATPGTDKLFLAYGLNNLASILIQLERYRDAEPLMLEADKGFRGGQGEASPFAAGSLASAGQASFALGEIATARDRLEQALKRAGTAGERDDAIRQRIFPDLIRVRAASGDAAGASALAERFRTIEAGLTRPFARAYAEALVQHHQPTRDAATARAAGLELLRLVENAQNVSSTGDLAAEHRAALDLVLEIAAADQDAGLGLGAMVLFAGSRIAQSSKLVADRFAAADPTLAARLRTFQTLTRDAAAKDSALLAALAKADGVEPARTTAAAAQSALDQARTALARDYPKWSEARGLERPSLATVQRRLAPGEALVGLIPAYAGVYVLLVTPDAARLHRTAAGRAEVVALVERLRGSLFASEFDIQAANALHTQLFPAGTRSVLKQAKSLRIVPSGAFSTLPMALLLERPTRRVDAKAPWLFRRYALSVQPGFAAAAERSETAAMTPRFLGVGAPVSGQPAAAQIRTAAYYYRGSGVGRGALASLPPLPGAERELAAIARGFTASGSVILAGRDADEAALKARDLSAFSLIVFSTHGLVSGEMEGVAEPALVLSPGAKDDGLLTASEIAGLQLAADWVVLSACNTAAGSGQGSAGAAYAGLAQAFRFAGARALLVSHWPVRDDAAAFLTTSAVRHAQAGSSKAEALRRAMTELIADRRIPEAAHPRIWAPFVLLE